MTAVLGGGPSFCFCCFLVAASVALHVVFKNRIKSAMLVSFLVYFKTKIHQLLPLTFVSLLSSWQLPPSSSSIYSSCCSLPCSSADSKLMLPLLVLLGVYFLAVLKILRWSWSLGLCVFSREGSPRLLLQLGESAEVQRRSYLTMTLVVGLESSTSSCKCR